MQIQNINIERFGRKQNVVVDGIADRLNVIYGPNGSGKSTTVQFLRWMLYGNCDDTTKRYVSDVDRTTLQMPTPGTAAGSLTFHENGRRRTMARQDDGSRYGRVALDGGSHYAKQSNHLTSLLGDVSQTDFDLLYAPELDRTGALSSLLQSSLARGIDLTSQRIPSERVQELRLRIDNYRSDMDRLPFTSGDLSALLDRKRAVERKIDEMEHETRRRRDEYDREFQEISRRIQDSELEIDRLRTEWHSRDEQVGARRRELEEAWRVADQAKQDFLARRRNELADIEANIARARSMQADVQMRRDRLEATLRDSNIKLDRNPKDIEETVCLVQSIAQQLDDIKTTDATVAEATPYRSAYRYQGTPPATSGSIDALRTQVGRLCETLQHERSEDRVRAMALELDELRQTDSAMDRWVRGLVSQQTQVQRELDDAQRFGVSLVVDRALKSTDPASPLGGADLTDMQLLDTLQMGKLRAVGHTCDGYEPVHPEHDGLLRQSTQHRDAAHEALQAAERELRHLMERRRDLEGALSRLSQQDMELAKRELAEVETLIRAAEERDRILREISKLEDQIARLRDSVRNSPVTQHAVKILRRLTRGRYRELRIDNTRDVSLEDESGAMVPLEHLSRGARDQVYLSFCFAIITAYRQRGIELPFILSDAFANVDSEKDDTLGAVLREFSDSGQQILVFTRHHYVANLLRNLGARYLELNARAVQQTVQTSEIDHVRFRPRSETGATSFSAPTPIAPAPMTRSTTYTEINDYPPRSSASYTTAEPLQNYVDFSSTHPAPPVRPTTGPTSFAPQPVVRETQVWDDGVSEYSTQRSAQPYRRVPNEPQASVNAPFENVTFSNDVPFQSMAQPSPVVRMGTPVTEVVQQRAPITPHRTYTQTHTQVRPQAAVNYPQAAAIHTQVAPSHTQTRPQPAANVTVRITRATPLETTGAMDSSAASRLRAAGIVTVGDFLHMAPAVAEDQLRKWGLESRPIRRWQDQLSLRCDLDGVEADDARLLVACGVCGIRDLAEADLDVLCERIGHLLSTQRTRSARRYVLRPGSYPRDRVAGWIRNARDIWNRERGNRGRTNTSNEMAPPYETEYDPDYVHNDPNYPSRSTSFTEGRSSSRSRSLTGDEYEQLDVERPDDFDNDGYYSGDRRGNGSGSESNRSGASRSGRSSQSGRSSRSSSSSSSSSRSGRSSRSSSSSSRESREPRASRSSRSSRSSQTSSRSRSNGDSDAKSLRFYLDRSDPVVDAPTIGPKMAKKLIAIGINTVDDLISANAATIASQLDDGRTDAATVTTWVHQAVLACRIPKMRGHDAQILVACGITSPDTLAAMNPDELWKIVRPFIKTSECKRIIRNGKAPDKDEIRDWIEWAQDARTLQAA